jgi:predicted phosphoribosyltransferase
MYKNRIEAGQILAEKLAEIPPDNLCLFAIPRGGVIVAQPIAHKLKTRINLLITRKLGHPANPEVAIGAVMPDGSTIWDQKAANLGHSEAELQNLFTREYAELKRRQLQFAENASNPEVKGKTTIIVDDGIATGYTITAAIKWLKKLEPKKIILAVPVAPLDIIRYLSEQTDQIICPLQAEDLIAVSLYYEDFSQTSDQEVHQIVTHLNNIHFPHGN